MRCYLCGGPGGHGAADGARRGGRTPLADQTRTLRKHFLVYAAILLAFGVGIFAVLERGRSLETARAAAPEVAASSEASPSSPSQVRAPLPILLLQLITIVLAARALGALFRRLGQPPVIGEIVAGIVLGPSLLGAAAPDVFAFLFPPASVGLLKLFAEIGVLLFLFAVGLELDVDRLRHQAQTAVVVSHASIVVPYFLGVGLALFLYTEFAPPGVGFLPFALFMGIAMSITAFPVLVRILKERGLAGTHLGRVAVDLRGGRRRHGLEPARDGRSPSPRSRGFWRRGITIVLTLVFIAAMLFLVGPLLRRACATRAEREEPRQDRRRRRVGRPAGSRR